eukprot:6838885-Prymnesium_polylepis.1
MTDFPRHSLSLGGTASGRQDACQDAAGTRTGKVRPSGGGARPLVLVHDSARARVPRVRGRGV